MRYLESAQRIKEGAYFPRHGFSEKVLQEAVPLNGGPALKPAQDAPLLLKAHIGDGLRVSRLSRTKRGAGKILEAGRAA